jgi:ankyrin repeat protein
MGMSPLMQAVSRGDPQMVNLMLNAAADVNVTSYGAGRTALMIACFKGETGIALQLIERGASWDIRDRSCRWSSNLNCEHFIFDGCVWYSIITETSASPCQYSSIWALSQKHLLLINSVCASFYFKNLFPLIYFHYALLSKCHKL